jgi:DNA-binding response OmpR family regulator
VTVAHDGQETLALAARLHPDFIVLDVLMPPPDGREVCRRLRAAGDVTPILLLTQVGVASERAMALEAGADDYLNKPFDPAELMGWDYPVATRAVDVRVAELRRVLEDDADEPRYVETVIGEGYRFVGPVEAAPP